MSKTIPLEPQGQELVVSHVENAQHGLLIQNSPEFRVFSISTNQWKAAKAIFFRHSQSKDVDLVGIQYTDGSGHKEILLKTLEQANGKINLVFEGEIVEGPEQQ